MFITRILKNLRRNALPDSESEDIRHLIDKGDLSAANQKVQRVLPNHPEHLLLLCLSAEIEFKQRNSTAAEEIYKRVLNLDPGFSEAHHGLSLLYAERSVLSDALEHSTFAFNKEKHKPHFRAQLGYCHLLIGNYALAEEHLRKAICLNPSDANSWNNLGIISIGKSDIQQALGCFQQAVKIDPNHTSAHKNLIDLATEFNITAPHTPVALKFDLIDEEHISKYSQNFLTSELPIKIQTEYLATNATKALALADILHDTCSKPYDFVSCARLYRMLGESGYAIDILEKAFSTHSDSEDLALALCIEYANTDIFDEALKYAKLAVELNHSKEALYLFYLGHTQHMLNRYQDASETLIEAIKICESEPLRRKLFKQIIASLIMACRYTEALEYCQTAEESGLLDANDVKLNSAYAYSFLGVFETAARILDELAEKGVKDPNLSIIRSIIHLSNEEWEQGWDHYQWRAFGDVKHLRTLPIPKWDGEPLEDCTIVVLAEQGLGDQIMFASCLGDLLELRPGQVIVEVHERLSNLFTLNYPTCQIVATRQKNDLDWMRQFSSADFFVPIADLPRHFRTKRHQFPERPFLKPDPILKSKWQNILEATCPKPWTGFSYKGGTETTRQTLRSVSMQKFIDAMAHTEGSLICLQYGDISSDIATLPSDTRKVHYWKESIADLSEFAALVSCLDAVVTVCNTTVHFAGSLGVKTLVLAPHIPEWRYGVSFRVMPWYPSVTVLRQPKHGEWEQLIRTTQVELDILLGQPHAKSSDSRKQAHEAM